MLLSTPNTANPSPPVERRNRCESRCSLTARGLINSRSQPIVPNGRYQPDAGIQFAGKIAVVFAGEDLQRAIPRQTQARGGTMNSVSVECYAGYRADERPLRFTLRGRAYHVQDLDGRWYSPGATYFRVRAEDGNFYVLRHDEAQDFWSLDGFRAAR